MSDLKIGDEVYIHGFVDEVRRDTVIIKNEGGYFGTVTKEIIPSAQPEFAKDKNVPSNNVISRQAVMALDMFTKIFCRDYAVQDDLAFRCNQCEFKMSNGKCLAKVMARKTCPDYKNFGCMGDL